MLICCNKTFQITKNIRKQIQQRICTVGLTNWVSNVAPCSFSKLYINPYYKKGGKWCKHRIYSTKWTYVYMMEQNTSRKWGCWTREFWLVTTEELFLSGQSKSIDLKWLKNTDGTFQPYKKVCHGAKIKTLASWKRQPFQVNTQVSDPTMTKGRKS